jgi:hypothetical protein
VKNKIEDLRNHLFAALEGLADRDNPLDLERARAIADVGRVVVDTAKAEIHFLQVAANLPAGSARMATAFFPSASEVAMADRPRLADGQR